MGARGTNFIAAGIVGLLVGGCALTPEPLDDFQLSAIADEKLVRVADQQEPIEGPISLYEAMARALKYNLNHRIEIFQRAVRERELDLTHYDKLPRSVVESGFARRDNYSASTSSVVANNQLVGGGAFQNFNTSQEKANRYADLEFSWHILDFGLSYVRARQAADKVLIAEEERRKIANQIVEDVRAAFWRAVSADRLVNRLQRLEGRTRAALANTRSLSRDGETSPITALTYERELVDIKRTIRELQRDLSVAKSELAALMNLKPGTKFALSYPNRFHAAPRLSGSAEEMIHSALMSRPELRDVAYRQRINEQEAHAALLELLPGIQLYAGSNYDSNDFLLNNDWLSWGAKASWNLMRIVQYPAKREVLDAQGDWLDQRSLAVAMAIMTQVHVSRIRYHHFGRELAAAVEYHDVQRRLVEKLRVEASAGRISEQTLIREEMNTLVAEVRRDVAHARVQSALASVQTSIGLDPYDSEIDTEQSVAVLAKTLRRVSAENMSGRRLNNWTTVALNP